jgi:hypothetical protein
MQHAKYGFIFSLYWLENIKIVYNIYMWNALECKL